MHPVFIRGKVLPCLWLCQQVSECRRRKYKLQVSAGGRDLPHKMVPAINLLHYSYKFQNFGGGMWNLTPALKSEEGQVQFYGVSLPKEGDNHDDRIMRNVLLLSGKVCIIFVTGMQNCSQRFTNYSTSRYILWRTNSKKAIQSH
jgi:hypothetical protein